MVSDSRTSRRVSGRRQAARSSRLDFFLVSTVRVPVSIPLLARCSFASRSLSSRSCGRRPMSKGMCSYATSIPTCGIAPASKDERPQWAQLYNGLSCPHTASDKRLRNFRSVREAGRLSAPLIDFPLRMPSTPRARRVAGRRRPRPGARGGAHALGSECPESCWPTPPQAGGAGRRACPRLREPGELLGFLVIPPCQLASMNTTQLASFAQAGRILATAARELGLVAPSFRTPPRVVGFNRTIRRDGNVVLISVVVRGRTLDAVLADMIEGVVCANDLSAIAADRVRNALWQQLGDSRGLGDSPLAKVPLTVSLAA